MTWTKLSPPSHAVPCKVFDKMMRMFHDLSPTKETLQDDSTISNIKEMVIDAQEAEMAQKGSCSESELPRAVLQKLTEEEMTRILYEFEQNNSLIERKGTTISNSTTDFKMNECETPAITQPGKKVHQKPDKGRVRSFPMPEKIAYDYTGQSISSKFSDVTSSTCVDGFELDEISPSILLTQHRPMLLPPTGAHNSRGQQKQKVPPLTLPPSPSPAAAAAAAAATSMSLSTSSNNENCREQPPSHQLDCVLETLCTVETKEDNDKIAVNNSKADPPLVGRKYKSIVNNTKEMATIEGGTEDLSNSPVPDKEFAVMKPKEISDEGVLSNNDKRVDEERDNNVCDKADEVLASTSENARRRDEEEHFHDGIMSAVAKAASSVGSVKLGEYDAEEFDAELHEVTSILTQYEEASKKAQEQENGLKAPAEEPMIAQESLSPKKVTFLEPLTDPTNPVIPADPLCGCIVQ